MAWGFNPYSWRPRPVPGAYIAVLESVAKLVATGFERANMYLTFQEYFEKLRQDPERWGKPVAAVLGALMAQVDLGRGRHRRQGLYVRLLRGLGRAAHARLLRDGLGHRSTA